MIAQSALRCSLVVTTFSSNSPSFCFPFPIPFRIGGSAGIGLLFASVAALFPGPSGPLLLSPVSRHLLVDEKDLGIDVFCHDLSPRDCGRMWRLDGELRRQSGRQESIL